MIAHAKVGNKAFGNVCASGEDCKWRVLQYAVTSAGHVQCAVVCWFSGGLSEVEMLSSGAAVVSVSRTVKIPS